jgi:uncharacterized protein (TIGR03083 family)
MRTQEQVAALDSEGRLLIEAADAAGLDAAVPTCPGWRVRDLLHHVGGVHRWAASFVRDGRLDPADPPQESFFAQPPDADLGEWFRAGHVALVTALRTADPGLSCWSFLPAPSPLAFWARRQAHETAIHRVDAQAALGRVTAVTPEFAVDGVAELLECFFARSRGRLVADPAVRLGVRATDTGHAWTVHIEPAGRRVVPEAQEADLVLRGAAAELYRLLWNRSDLDAVHAEGDLAVWRLWQERARITWS